MSAIAQSAEVELLEIARELARSLRPLDGESRYFSLDSRLQEHLGLDSLGRMELFSRVERHFAVRLPPDLLGEATTLRDIARVLTSPSAQPGSAAAKPARVHDRQSVAGAPPPAMDTLKRVLQWHCEQHPQAVQITVCEEQHEESITYQRLWDEAGLIAGGLQHLGVRPHDAVALMLPTGADYFSTFFGVLLAGAVPVPIYPPLRASQLEEHIKRHAGILENCRAVALVTDQTLRPVAGSLRRHAGTLRKVTTAAELRALTVSPVVVAANAADIALLQYTSGSTGHPKGVILSHANLLANIQALGSALQVTATDVFVSWLPLYHDMGLIGAWLGTLYFGLPLVVMSPLRFLARPIRWLQAIDHYGGTLSAAPNFAYELCLKRISDAELTDLDLHTWRMAANGAEFVVPSTLERFQQRFARCGLQPSALTPVYGLAECSVGLAISPVGRGPLIDAIDRDALMTRGAAQPSTDLSTALRFASCGVPLPQHQVRIVDAAGHELGERCEGRLEFRGPSATRGYFDNPLATAGLLHAGWLDSGDRAYRAAGEIYITGRIKDIIIRAGRHIHPEELEAAVGAIEGVRKGCVAVIGSSQGGGGTERVIVLAESAIAARAQREQLKQSIASRIVAVLGEPADAVVLVAPRTILKTSSGKIRRSACRELYESKRYRTLPRRMPPMPLWRLTSLTVMNVLRDLRQQLAALLFAGRFAALLTVLGGGTYLSCLAATALTRRWSIAHRAARLLLRWSGLPFTVEGREHLRAQQILVVNHASYLDALCLVAALERPCRFIAKQELAGAPLLGSFLRRLGVLFVERFDIRASVEAAKRVATVAGSGPPCIFFPEGTFTAQPGLRPFHLGAFAAAVESGLPVVPLCLQGTRAVLPDRVWRPRRGNVRLRINPALLPAAGTDTFAAAVQLRDAARQTLLEQCGEPDLQAPAVTPGDGAPQPC